MVPRDDMRNQPAPLRGQTLEGPDGPGCGVIGALGWITKARLEIRAIFAEVVHTPGKSRDPFRSEASPAASRAGLHLGKMAGKRLPFLFGTAGYAMSIVTSFWF